MCFFQGQNSPKKYVNKEYGFSVSLPTINDFKKQNIDAVFANISRIRIVADTQRIVGLVKYNVTYRIIAESFVPKEKIDNASFYKEIKDGVIQMQDKSNITSNVKVISKNIEVKLKTTTVTYKLEYIGFPLLETRKIVIRDNKSFSISYLTRPEYFDETRV